MRWAWKSGPDTLAGQREGAKAAAVTVAVLEVEARAKEALEVAVMGWAALLEGEAAFQAAQLSIVHNLSTSLTQGRIWL